MRHAADQKVIEQLKARLRGNKGGSDDRGPDVRRVRRLVAQRLCPVRGTLLPLAQLAGQLAMNWHLRLLAWRAGRKSMRSDRMLPPSAAASSSTTGSGVLALKRVTIRHCAAERPHPIRRRNSPWSARERRRVSAGFERWPPAGIRRRPQGPRNRSTSSFRMRFKPRITAASKGNFVHLCTIPGMESEKVDQRIVLLRAGRSWTRSTSGARISGPLPSRNQAIRQLDRLWAGGAAPEEAV
jgi:hypothetical protein